MLTESNLHLGNYLTRHGPRIQGPSKHDTTMPRRTPSINWKRLSAVWSLCAGYFGSTWLVISVGIESNLIYYKKLEHVFFNEEVYTFNSTELKKTSLFWLNNVIFIEIITSIHAWHQPTSAHFPNWINSGANWFHDYTNTCINLHLQSPAITIEC